MVGRGKSIHVNIKRLPERTLRGGVVGLALCVSLLIVVAGNKGVYSRQVTGLEEQLAALTEEKLQLGSMKPIPEVEESWFELHLLAERYGVELIPLEVRIDPPYSGPAGAWHWILRGELKDIAVVLKEGEEVIPMIVGEMAYQSGRATVSVSVLGSVARSEK